MGDLNVVEMCNSQSFVLLVRMNHDLNAKLVASSLFTETSVEAGLWRELVCIKFFGTWRDLVIPLIIGRTTHPDVPSKEAYFASRLDRASRDHLLD